MNEEQRKAAAGYLKEELKSAAVYRSLAAVEDDPARAEVFEGMAEDELRHARRWADFLGRDSSNLKPARLGIAGILISLIARLFGTSRVMGLLVRGEDNTVREYWAIDSARDMARDERRHGLELRRLSGEQIAEGEPTPHPEGGFLKGEGGTLRAAVLGVNDGLVSNFSLVMGVAGGVDDASVVLLAGIAGLIAGAFSMAAGEYISMRSQRDVYENLLEEERTEIELWPDEERLELVNIYMQKGLTQEEATNVASRIFADAETALDTMAREELGLDPDDLGSPWGAAWASMLAFAAGAIVPIAPYLFGEGDIPFVLSASLSALALLVVGAGLAWMSSVNAWWGGLRMLLVGGFAAAVTYGVGSAIGVAID